MEVAQADTELLRTLDAQGDNFSLAREVDFLLRAPSLDKAQTVASFLSEYQYGSASVQSDETGHSVRVLINMPIEQNAILSVSGFMTCVSALFGLEYDGWGCVAQSRT